jgi:hypothetical protein
MPITAAAIPMSTTLLMVGATSRQRNNMLIGGSSNAKIDRAFIVVPQWWIGLVGFLDK